MKYVLLISFFLALGHSELNAFNTDNQTGLYIFVYDKSIGYYENVPPTPLPAVSDGYPNPPKSCITLSVCESYKDYKDCAIDSIPRSCNIKAGGQQVVKLDASGIPKPDCSDEPC